MAKIFVLRGLSVEEIKKLSLAEFMPLIGSRERRTLKRGFTSEQKIFMEDVKKGRSKLKTHCRDLVITPPLLDKRIQVHNGKEFVEININPEMLGHRLGEFALTRKKVTHTAKKK
ncbi:30S ribosomal protein S19 [Candidatus Woesearchaeota archaeon]|jgi:small subunit ribosomal protein S19|nr:30S ribosomal protein S19 [Candidatus Woesearchaeota archaeon]MBT4387752.1 30S ribosomal protein S19 [Candidatus Woesearchaeota archaeon]MBT4595571.1 30S ribosomal protein S19 [Candidatus Woesearchaeota archaeon]MBT5740946.1 30S ribosomal protein S19 [Candidatus Woesearchaeota archaeon]MBT6506113.1 30S ribosomal protein S19 [Candidatus Woesearchaeota archaeon]